MENREHRVRERAYAIWQAEGCPAGHDQEHWKRAILEIAAETRETPKREVSEPGSNRHAPADVRVNRGGRSGEIAAPAVKRNGSAKSADQSSKLAPAARKPKTKKS